MGASSKTASTTQTMTTNENKDQKATAGDNSLVLAAGSVLDYTNNFSPEVKDVFMEVLDLGQQSINKLSDNQMQSLELIKQRFENQESDLSRLKEFLLPIIIAGSAVAIVNNLK